MTKQAGVPTHQALSWHMSGQRNACTLSRFFAARCHDGGEILIMLVEIFIKRTPAHKLGLFGFGRLLTVKKHSYRIMSLKRRGVTQAARKYDALAYNEVAYRSQTQFPCTTEKYLCGTMVGMQACDVAPGFLGGKTRQASSRISCAASGSENGQHNNCVMSPANC